MNIVCRLGFHKPLHSNVWNDGWYFSRCTRCDHDLIRKPAERWKIVPPNLRVVWRQRAEDDIKWPSHLL